MPRKPAASKTAPASLPVLHKERVWHVGNLKRARRKAPDSQEGTLLSVSEYPRAWTRIAQLGGSPTFMLVRKDGKEGVFVNRHALTASMERKILAGSGLVTKTKVYILRENTFDDNDDPTVYQSVHATREEAERNVLDPEAFELGEATVTERAGWAATPELNRRWEEVFSSPLRTSFAGEFALMETIEALGLYDGMWWNEVLDPWALSAPRGGIFQSRLSEWKAVEEGKRGYVEPDEDENEEDGY